MEEIPPVDGSVNLETAILDLIAKATKLVPVRGSLILYAGARDRNESYLLNQGGIQRYYREIRNGTPITRYEKISKDEFLCRVFELPPDVHLHVYNNLIEYLQPPSQQVEELDKPEQAALGL